MTKKKKNHKLGVIVPYRDRYLQLVKFKQHICNFLDKKKLDYVLIVVEQDDAKLFNRGKLLNIGFKEALNENCDYVVFHDVDMLPLNVDYSYEDVPIHLATDFITDDKEFHRELFDCYFGGVTIFPTDVFQIINGYSNEYWGWGFEDDDLFKRCVDKGIPYDIKHINVPGGSDLALRFNGVDAYIHGKHKLDLTKQFSILITIDPDGVVCDTEKGSDKYTALSIPEIDLTIGYDSFRRYKFLMKDSDSWSYIDSKIDTNRKTTLVITVNSVRKSVIMYQDGELIGKSKFKKELKNSKKELFIGSKDGYEDLFKGNILQVAFYNKILNPATVKTISSNKNYSLTMPFEGYEDDGFLVQYHDMKFIRNYKLIDLIDTENNLTIENCSIEEYEKSDTQVIKVPFRKRSYFEVLSHSSSGYIDGEWSDINIRYNQLRFHNEMEKGYRNPDADGLSNLKYKVWGREKINKQINLNVSI